MIKRFYNPPIPQDHLQEFFERTGRLIGLLAIALPAVTGLFALFGIVPMRDSISHFYYTRWTGDFIVGALSFIGISMALLYNTNDKKIIGWSDLSKLEARLVRLVGVLALLVAFFPAFDQGGPAPNGEILRSFTVVGGTHPMFHLTEVNLTSSGDLGSTIHNAAAAVMFLLLFYFLAVVFRRDQRSQAGAPSPHKSKKKLRNSAYTVLALLMLVSIVVMGWDIIFIKETNDACWNHHNFTYVLEALGLGAFGIGWLIKGRAFPCFNDVEQKDRSPC